MLRNSAVAEIDVTDPGLSFTVIKPGTYNGKELRMGDRLPIEGIDPVRLEKLVRLRFVEAKMGKAAPKAAPARVAKATKATAKPKEKAPLNLAEFNISELRELCKQNNIPVLGNRAQLVKRLTQKLA